MSGYVKKGWIISVVYLVLFILLLGSTLYYIFWSGQSTSANAITVYVLTALTGLGAIISYSVWRGLRDKQKKSSAKGVPSEAPSAKVSTTGPNPADLGSRNNGSTQKS